MKAFEQTITVQQHDIDRLNHVNNVVYLQWVQDVATAHWQSLASMEIQKKYSWVVLKHEIEYFSPALLNDFLTVKTWVEKSEGVRSERHVEFYNHKTNKLLVRAKTNWCLLEAMTMRPRRIEEDILQLFH
ncbi:MAG TPA: thioesterase family protein [Cyclobacteriaceae bacterium]|nr:thioesterase family protein [Cyclobacteriaceae bacterium]HRJ82454.1 thioesterase family protein [Cyclobacteriaceae bacterium]